MFQPTRTDGRSFRDVALDVLKDEPPGSVVSYKIFGAALGLNPKTDLQKIQATVRQANRILLKLHSRGLATVPRVGYRVLHAREHAIIANGHERRADSAMGRSVAFYNGAKLEEMTPSERRIHEGLSMNAQTLMAMHSYNKTRFDRLEALFKGPVVDEK
jgi:hypothetical protein